MNDIYLFVPSQHLKYSIGMIWKHYNGMELPLKESYFQVISKNEEDLSNSELKSDQVATDGGLIIWATLGSNHLGESYGYNTITMNNTYFTFYDTNLATQFSDKRC